MGIDRPKHPGQSSSQSQATQRNRGSGGKNTARSPGGGGNKGGRGHSNSEDPPPSPWLLDAVPEIDPHASFIEYLRWMREPGRDYKDATKLQLLQMAEEGANYSDRLKILTNRTRKLAIKHFEATCSWRMRVGGHRGPESILLPAFDALGIPYIPSSTLRGVARTQAIREKMERGISWKEADREVATWFGHLDADKPNQAGKIVFLDAYPLPQLSGKKGGLAMDMANNIWKWDGGKLPKYDPNPNPFFSLEKPTFLIGLRPASGCKNENTEEMLEQVKAWVIRGLQLGIGSQVNTGYGSFVMKGEKPPIQPFFQMEFSLEGQLIHGRQTFNRWDGKKAETTPEPEVRPIALKSMLRYWFRTFALGVLSSGHDSDLLKNYLKAIREGRKVSPPAEVKALESLLFGSITPQTLGWVKFQILDSENYPSTKTEPAQQYGKFALYINDDHLPDSNYREVLVNLFTALTWMTVRLGGLGQGARRPCYDRSSKPHWRGSTFILDPDEQDSFWENPKTVREFRVKFKEKLNLFYSALNQLLCLEQQSRKIIDPNNSHQILLPSNHSWAEAIDHHCKIIVVQGKSSSSKPYSLDVLHALFHELEDNGRSRDAKSLCGGTKKEKVSINSQETQSSVPSPVIISSLENYQMITIFGATQDPRKKFLQKLREKTSDDKFAQIWPFT